MNKRNLGRKRERQRLMGMIAKKERQIKAFNFLHSIYHEGMTLNDMAFLLNQAGYRTPLGKLFTPLAAQRLFNMLGDEMEKRINELKSKNDGEIQ